MRHALAGAALALALARAASADTVAATLGDPAAESHYYEITCSDDGAGAPVSFSAQVRDEAPASAPLVSVQLRVFRSPSSYSARNATDAVDGDGSSSPLVFVNGGPGRYDVFVDKSAAGEEDYLLAFQCTTAADGGGAPTGSEITATNVVVSEPVPALGFAAQLALCALLLAGLARGALAHTQSGSLGDAAGATDYYQITCLDDGAGAPAALEIQVLDAAPSAAPLVSVQARRALLLANSTDATDADAGYSPLVRVNGGAGVYDVLVDKSAAGAESYTLQFHCTTAGGDHTGTEIVTRQNQ